MMIKSAVFYVCGAGLILTACQPASEAPQGPRPVWVMTVGPQQSSPQHHYTGEIKSRYESNIGFRVGGKIIRRLVNVGDRVNSGQVLAELDASDTRLQSQAANADVQAAEANLALAKAELARRQQLYQQQFISKSALDSYDTQVKTAQARLQQAQAQANISQHQTGYHRLLADRAGVVGMVQAEPGQVVATGQTVARIYDTQQLEVHIAIPESVITRLKPGDTAHIWLAQSTTPWQGAIREIAAAANSQTRAFDVRVRFVDVTSAMASQTLKLGMTATVQLDALNTTPSSGTLRVPSTAVSHAGADSIVWVIDAQQKAYPRKVTTGDLQEDGVLITGGLQTGERIATVGVHTLIAGQSVRAIVPDPEVLK